MIAFHSYKKCIKKVNIYDMIWDQCLKCIKHVL